MTRVCEEYDIYLFAEDNKMTLSIVIDCELWVGSYYLCPWWLLAGGFVLSRVLSVGFY